MKIHALGGLPHYLDHLRAVHQHLPDDIRGEVREGPQVNDRHWPEEDLVMIAGAVDVGKVMSHRMVFVEHGSGQRYAGLPKWAQPYYGPVHDDRIVAYLGPRQACVDEWDVPGFAMGAPVCDPYELFGEDGVVAITFHWSARRLAAEVPEAGTAFDHYVDDLVRIIDSFETNGYEVLAHRHPRFKHLRSVWKHLGIPEADIEEVRTRAGTLVADNTSLLFEMSHLGRRTISLNSPCYRRDVDHGLRFWDAAPGTQVDGPDELIEQISLLNPPDSWSGVPSIAAYGKALSDGGDGFRAASWLSSLAASF